MDDILSEFIAETTETLEDLGGALVAWENSPDDIQLLNAIFRFFHTIKGSAGFLQLEDIGAIAHVAEDMLDQVRQGDARADAALVTQVHGYIDQIMAHVRALQRGDEAPDKSADASRDILAPSPEKPVSQELEALPLDQNLQDRNRSLRVSVALIDSLLNTISDFSILANEYNGLLSASAVNPKLRQMFGGLSRLANDVRSSASQLRLQRMDRLFAPLPKAVRDLSASCGKLVDIRMSGGSIELDRDMLDALRDPIGHILRNAIDHGIERPDVRESTGKPRIGELVVEALRRGNDIEIRISDDGAGLNLDAIRKVAQERGLLPDGTVQTLGEAQIKHILTAPGFSTREEADVISGRGVGLDVVRSNIEAIGGQFDLHSETGRGVTICLRVPLSLSIVSCLIVQVGGTNFHIPTEAIQQIWLADNPKIRLEAVAGTHVLRTDEGIYSVVALDNMMGLHAEGAGEVYREAIPLNEKVIITMKSGQSSEFAIMVDDAIEYADAVIRPIPPMVAQAGPFCGVSLHDNGSAILLLDMMEIADFAQVISLPSDAAADVENLAEVLPQDSVQALTFVIDAQGKNVAIPFDFVRHVDAFAETSLVALDGEYWHRTANLLLPMAVSEKTDIQACQNIVILGDGADQIAYPVQSIMHVMQKASVQRQRTSRTYIGVTMMDDAAVPILNIPHLLTAMKIAEVQHISAEVL